MKRADRQDSSHDNALNHPQSRQQEPVSQQERAALVMTLRGTLTEKQQELDQANQQLERTRQEYQSTLALYREAQTYLPLYNEEKAKNTSLLTQLGDAQQQFQQYFSLYNEAKTNSENLVLQIQAAQAETQKYLTLYNQSQADLQAERRSKAGIKSWETRRKRENERLKQEVAEMMVVLRDAMERKEIAIQNLDVLANRMDKIQSLVDSVEADSNDSNPLGLLAKFRRMWRAIQEILAE